MKKSKEDDKRKKKRKKRKKRKNNFTRNIYIKEIQNKQYKEIKK